MTLRLEKEAAAKMLASDGLHPSAVAYDEWATALAQRLASPWGAASP